MKCRRARGLIHDFIDGVIDEPNRASLEQHLRVCKTCEDVSTGLTRSLDLLHQLEPARPDENFTWKVRLRLARERNALSDPADTQQYWVRSWNRRFALSALSALVVMMGATFVVTKSSLMPADTDPFSRLARSPRKNETAEPKVTGPAAGRLDNRPARSGILVSTADPGGHADKRGGALEGDRLPGLREEEVTPQLDLDSLMRQYVKSAARSVAETQRLRNLKDQVDLLTSELTACGERCGGGSERTHDKK